MCTSVNIKGIYLQKHITQYNIGREFSYFLSITDAYKWAFYDEVYNRVTTKRKLNGLVF